MYLFFQKFHSGWAYLVLLAVALLFVFTFYHFLKKTKTNTSFKRLLSFSLVFLYIQMIVGIILYFVSPILTGSMAKGMATVMKDATIRLYLIEHPFMMVIGMLLMTIAYYAIKKSHTVNWKIFLLIAFSFLSIASRIPYKVWLG